MTRQSTDYTCGVAALQSILVYYGDEIREDNLAKSLGVSATFGIDYQHIVDYSKSKGYNVTIYKNMTLENLEQLIAKGSPIICAIQAWSEIIHVGLKKIFTQQFVKIIAKIIENFCFLVITPLILVIVKI